MSIFLLLPFAQWKTVIFGIPLYSVEMPVLLALLTYVYGWRHGVFSPLENINLRSPFVIAITLFFLGATLSLIANPLSLTGLGMLKTWFVFPLLALWLWLETKPGVRELERALFIWLAVTVAIALVSLIFLWQGALTYDGRLQGWYASPNYLAFMLAPGTLLAAYFLSHAVRAERKSLIPPLLFCGALILLVSALFFTRSYALWLSVFVALAVFLVLDGWTRFSRYKKIALIVLFAGIVSSVVFFEAESAKWQALTTLDERSSLASRGMIWQAAGKIIADSPVWGIGLGRFQEVYLSYQHSFPPYLEWAVPEPHNLSLALWLHTGLIGLGGFIGLIFCWLGRLYTLLRSETGEAGTKSIAALLIGLLALFLVSGLFDTPFFKTDLAFSFWLLLAFTLGLLNKQKSVG